MIHLPTVAVSAVPPLLTVLCAFALRTGAAFCVAWLIARLGTSARFRFAVWLIYLIGAAAYWIGALAKGFTSAKSAQAIPASDHFAPANAVLLSSAQMQTLAFVLTAALAVYLTMLAVLVLRGVWRHLRLWRALRARIAPTAHIRDLCAGIASQTGLRRCRIWLLPSLTSAASAGFIRPAVYLPVDACETSDAELQDILCHEMTHIARSDGLWDLLLRTSRALLIFHPAAGYAVRSLRLERELACDREVVRADPARRDAYAETLVRFGWRLAPDPGADTFGLRFAAQSTVLSRRVKDILAGERIYSSWSRGGRAVLGTAGACAFACALPVLCIAFGAIVLPQRPAEPVLANAFPPSHAILHRNAPAATARPTSSAAPVASGPTSVPQPAPAAKYKLYPSASAPMSDIASSDAPGASVDRTPQEASNGLPSAPTVLTEAAVSLGQLAATRDRDHDLH